MKRNGQVTTSSVVLQAGRLGRQKTSSRPAEERAAAAPSALPGSRLPVAADKTAPVEKIKAILEERARALSRSTEIKTEESMQLVVFTLANETYGVATDYVREVQPLRNVSPVPCTPDFVVGVINIRGSIYSVIDIRGFFGVQKQAITDLTKVILVNAAGLEVGILADDVKGATSVPLSEIKAALAAQTTVKDEYVQGVTKDMLIILNLEAVLRDERVIIHQEVG